MSSSSTTGEGEPQVLIASDLPMQGSSRTQTVQMVEGIRFVLEQRGWKAGDTRVAFQACDDSTAQAGKWDPAKCSQNARLYAQNEAVVGIVGTFNSGCAAIEIPVLGNAPGGGVAMVSPANTFVCLTESGPGCAKDEPDRYYPTGTRNYARMVAHDAYQGAAVAKFADSIGIESIYILNDREAYGLGVAENFQNAVEELGIEVAGFAAWDPKASSYEALFRKVKASGAQAVFLGGLICENGAQVIKDKVAVLGPNAATPDEGVVLLTPGRVHDPGDDRRGGQLVGRALRERRRGARRSARGSGQGVRRRLPGGDEARSRRSSPTPPTRRRRPRCSSRRSSRPVAIAARSCRPSSSSRRRTGSSRPSSS